MNDMNMDHALEDDALEAVSGGFSDRMGQEISAETSACASYICKYCGMRGALTRYHSTGCWCRKNPDQSTDPADSGINRCGTCKYATEKGGVLVCGYKRPK